MSVADSEKSLFGSSSIGSRGRQMHTVNGRAGSLVERLELEMMGQDRMIYTEGEGLAVRTKPDEALPPGSQAELTSEPTMLVLDLTSRNCEFP